MKYDTGTEGQVATRRHVPRCRWRVLFYRMGEIMAITGLVGCAQIYEGKYDWDQGWRLGTVIEVGLGAALPPIASGDCRNEATPAEVARTRYADVRYQNEGRWTRHRIVPIDDGDMFSKGQAVYFKANDCTEHLVRASAGTGVR